MFGRVFRFGKRDFSSLSEQEILAIAISSEEDDARIYKAYADGLREQFPQSAKVFDDMAAEENQHRRRLIEQHRARFGETIPLIRREHVAGFYARRPVWLMENLGIERIRAEAEAMERDAEAFYHKAAQRTADAATRKLLGDLAAAEYFNAFFGIATVSARQVGHIGNRAVGVPQRDKALVIANLGSRRSADRFGKDANRRRTGQKCGQVDRVARFANDTSTGSLFILTPMISRQRPGIEPDTDG